MCVNVIYPKENVIFNANCMPAVMKYVLLQYL